MVRNEPGLQGLSTQDCLSVIALLSFVDSLLTKRTYQVISHGVLINWRTLAVHLFGSLVPLAGFIVTFSDRLDHIAFDC